MSHSTDTQTRWCVGVNCKEFKDAVESQGVTDDMKLKRIDVATYEMDSGVIDVLLKIPGGVVII